jgi:small subunit ribosomal protein S16
MTVKIRLKRVGKTKQPSYRVVVADSRSPRDGRIIENLGWYNPLTEPSTINVNEEKVLNWLNNGAQPTESVAILLKRVGVMDRFEQSKVRASTPAQTETVQG